MSWHDGWQQWEPLPAITIDVFHQRGTRPGPHALITGGIHGDEYEGPAAISAFAAQFDAGKLSGSVTAIPVCNPPAFLAGTRLNPDGLNLARCFPGDESGKPTERLAAALFSRLAAGTDYLIDLHSGGVEYLFLPVAGFYGEAVPENPSFEAARRFGLPALWQLPETPGVLSREMRRLGTVVIGNEYRGAGQLSNEGAAAYCQGIFNCLAGWGLYDVPVHPLPEQSVLLGDWQLAKANGLFRSDVETGQKVERGQHLASILTAAGTILEEFRAPIEGVVGALRSKAYVHAGNWAVMVLEERHAG